LKRDLIVAVPMHRKIDAAGARFEAAQNDVVEKGRQRRIAKPTVTSRREGDLLHAESATAAREARRARFPACGGPLPQKTRQRPSYGLGELVQLSGDRVIA
jgi:hypothetical protein